FVAWVIGSMAGVPLAIASNGGPELAEVLGWDPVEKKVFFEITYVDESGRAPGIFYFDLNGRAPGRAQRVAWSHVDTGNPDYGSRLKVLRRRLKPLEPVLAPTIPESQKTVSVDTLRN